MGLLDVLLGRRKLAKPAEDRLFAISTAYVTLETSLEGTICFTYPAVFNPVCGGVFLQLRISEFQKGKVKS